MSDTEYQIRFLNRCTLIWTSKHLGIHFRTISNLSHLLDAFLSKSYYRLRRDIETSERKQLKLGRGGETSTTLTGVKCCLPMSRNCPGDGKRLLDFDTSQKQFQKLCIKSNVRHLNNCFSYNQ